MNNIYIYIYIFILVFIRTRSATKWTAALKIGMKHKRWFAEGKGKAIVTSFRFHPGFLLEGSKRIQITCRDS